VSFLREGRPRHALASIALLQLVGQIGLIVSLPIAEARAETGADLTLHIEAVSDKACAPAHDPMACSFCRVLASKSLGAKRTSRTATWSLVIAPHCQAVKDDPACWFPCETLQARAPPSGLSI
jgi:hypothetical protein